jgi:hypothetical protein
VFWDDLVRRWRRESKVISPQMLRATGGHIAVLPAPRRQRQVRLVVLLVVLLALGAALLAASGRISFVSNGASATPATSGLTGTGTGD